MNNEKKHVNDIMNTAGLAAAFAAGIAYYQGATVAGIVAAAIVVAALTIAYSLDVFSRIQPALTTAYGWVKVFLVTGQRRERDVSLSPLEVYLGEDVDTGAPFLSRILDMGSIGLYGMTGTGKTSLLHALIYMLTAGTSPRDLQLVIADLKDGLDFRFFRRLPHLLYQVAETEDEAAELVTAVLGEMKRRQALFKQVPEDRVCNDLDLYHALRDELGLDLPRLPIVVFIVDEFQNLTEQKPESIDQLSKIAKMGRAFGISLICATQLMNVDAVPRKIKSQFTTTMIGFLTNPSDYYKIAELPQDWWKRMSKKIRGRFIMTIAGVPRMVQAAHVERKVLENHARAMSTKDEPGRPDNTGRHVKVGQEWGGSRAQKQAALFAWFETLEVEPTADQFAEHFNAARATFYNNDVQSHWESYVKQRALDV